MTASMVSWYHGIVVSLIEGFQHLIQDTFLTIRFVVFNQKVNAYSSKFHFHWF